LIVCGWANYAAFNHQTPHQLMENACAELIPDKRQEETVMSRKITQTSRHLNAREVLDVRDGQGMRVECLRGVLWITQSNDTNDIVVGGGESFMLDRPGLALISAPIGPADIVIQPAARRPVEQERRSLLVAP
jgi:hypothetical protein